MKILTTFASGIFMISSMSPVIAQTDERPEHQTGVTFDQLMEHYPEASIDRFNALDLNDDGLLTRQERQRAQWNNGQERFSNLDTDGSGGLSLDEIQQRNPDATGERFARFDRNEDGELGQREARFANKKRQRFNSRPDAQGRPTDGQRRGGQVNRAGRNR